MHASLFSFFSVFVTLYSLCYFPQQLKSVWQQSVEKKSSLWETNHWKNKLPVIIDVQIVQYPSLSSLGGTQNNCTFPTKDGVFQYKIEYIILWTWVPVASVKAKYLKQLNDNWELDL